MLTGSQVGCYAVQWSGISLSAANEICVGDGSGRVWSTGLWISRLVSVWVRRLAAAADTETWSEVSGQLFESDMRLYACLFGLFVVFSGWLDPPRVF